jgi:hypothetical protein
MECIGKHPGADQETQQELDAERSAERIDHVATLAVGQIPAKTTAALSRFHRAGIEPNERRGFPEFRPPETTKAPAGARAFAIEYCK